MRLIAAIRLSQHQGESDPSTSPERQRADIEEYVTSRSARVVHWARDLDVSAITLSPFERPAIGPWLTPDQAPMYDGIVWSRMDRGIRNQTDLHELGLFALKHRKILIFVSGPGGSAFTLDFRNGPLDPVTHLMASMLAFGAQMEAEAILFRNRQTKAFLRARGLWTGGRYPFYLQPEQTEKTGNHWTLVLNTKKEPLAREIVRMALADDDDSKIAAQLNDAGVPSPREEELRAKGEWSMAPTSGRVVARDKTSIKIESDVTGEIMSVDLFPKYGRWGVKAGDTVVAGQRLLRTIYWGRETIRAFLTNRYLIGESERGGKIDCGEDGLPIQVAEALIDRKTWDRLAALRAQRAKPTAPKTRKDAALLLNILKCGRCGSDYYHSATPARDGGAYAYYRCGSKSSAGHKKVEGNCEARLMHSKIAHGLVEQALLDTIGNLPRQKKIFVPGENHSAEIQELSAAYEDLLKETAGKSPAIKEIYKRQIAGLEARINYLSSIPVTNDRFEIQSEGVTYREVWERASYEGQRKLLIESGIIAFGERRHRRAETVVPYVDPGTMLAVVVEDGEHVVVVAIPKDIAQRTTGHDVDLGYRDKTLWDAVGQTSLNPHPADLAQSLTSSS